MKIQDIIIRSLLSLAAASLLSGCLAVAAGGTAGYLMAKDKGGIRRYTSDSIITSKVKSRLLAADDIDSMDISVSTSKGVVSLSGQVKTSKIKGLAIGVAKKTAGVKEVKAGNLTVSAA